MKKHYNCKAKPTPPGGGECRKSDMITGLTAIIMTAVLMLVFNISPGFCANNNPLNPTIKGKSLCGAQSEISIPDNIPISNLPVEKNQGNVNVNFKVGLLKDSVIHLVWDNLSGISVNEIVLERSNDGQNFTAYSLAKISNLQDIHANNYPQNMNHEKQIILSTESGSTRFIFNDIV
ncbi:MAG: hypothetical protein V2A54_14495, partial [Bacteroidota bacterium]